jgi:hypothetical protein
MDDYRGRFLEHIRIAEFWGRYYLGRGWRKKVGV